MEVRLGRKSFIENDDMRERKNWERSIEEGKEGCGETRRGVREGKKEKGRERRARYRAWKKG